MRERLRCLKASLYVFFDTLALAVSMVRTQPEKPVVLLIRVDAIGDFVLWLDTAKEYRKLYPSEEYRIVLVGNKLWGELAESRSISMKMESEKRYLICALQASLLENHKVKYENIYDILFVSIKSLQYVEYEIT